LKVKIKNHKNFDKRENETNKKSKEKGSNWNKYYNIIKKIINLIWRVKLKTIKPLTKKSSEKIRNQK